MLKHNYSFACPVLVLDLEQCWIFAEHKEEWCIACRFMFSIIVYMY